MNATYIVASYVVIDDLLKSAPDFIMPSTHM
jgi:hypothetical protein